MNTMELPHFDLRAVCLLHFYCCCCGFIKNRSTYRGSSLVVKRSFTVICIAVVKTINWRLGIIVHFSWVIWYKYYFFFFLNGVIPQKKNYKQKEACILKTNCLINLPSQQCSNFQTYYLETFQQRYGKSRFVF